MNDTQTTEPAPGTAPRLWTIEDAAEILDVSPRQIWQLIHDGELSRVRLGYRTTRVRDDELAALIERNTERGAD